MVAALIKKKIIFSSCIRKCREIGCKVIYDWRPPIWWKYLCISSYIRKPFPHIWLCNHSYLNFLIYEENLVFFFLSLVGYLFSLAGRNVRSLWGCPFKMRRHWGEAFDGPGNLFAVCIRLQGYDQRRSGRLLKLTRSTHVLRAGIPPRNPVSLR